MTNQEAAEILCKHNIWRRGDDTFNMANPKELGIAIDMAVAALQKPSTDRAIEKIEACRIESPPDDLALGFNVGLTRAKAILKAGE